TVGVPVALQRDGARFASLGTDVGLVRDPGVRRLTGLRECRCQLGYRRQLAPWVRGNQHPSDLALDFVVAPFSDPPPHEASALIEEVFRWPRVVPERAPDGEVIVDGNRIRQSVVTNPSVDVAGVLAKLKLWRVHADHDQPERRVRLI